MKNLFFREYGNNKNPHLFILHGLYGASDNWIPIAKKLARNYHVVVPDMRNHGKSFWHPEHSIAVLADDIIRLANELQWKNFSLVGHSFGGKVALFLTDKYSRLVDKTIVLDISPFQVKYMSQIESFHDFVLNGYATLKNKQNIYSRKELLILMERYFPKDKRLLNFLSKNIILTQRGRIELKLAIDYLLVNKKNLFATLSLSKESLQKSVLFLVGENSMYISQEDMEQLRYNFVKAKIVIIKEASHWLHYEKPQEVYNAIVNFIK